MDKVLSNYFKKEFDVTTFDGNGKKAVSHSSLENIINNQIPVEQKVIYNYEVISASVDHSVVICTICDKTGRRISGIGEASAASLKSDIAKLYPTKTAAKRAFDSAVMSYLDLSEELEPETEAEEINKSEATNIPGQISIKEIMEEEPPIGNCQVVTNAEKIELNNPKNKLTDLEAIIINTGKYKGKGLTLKEVYEKDKPWCDWLASQQKGAQWQAVAEYEKIVGI